MKTPLLRRIIYQDFRPRRREAVDAGTLADAAAIIADVRRRGEIALREYSERFGDLKPGEEMHRDVSELKAAFHSLPLETRQLLQRTAERIRHFAKKQLTSLRELSTNIDGGKAGHTIAPVESAGCYAPGGRFPLPSSVLMTAVTARVAGVKSVWVASPRPGPETLAAAHIAGADGVLALGGAQAIAALAYGTEIVPASDVIVGPGNRWVTAAKKLVAGDVAIDMLAGPSELVVLADGTADPALVAADLLAQAEHDPDAFPALVTVDEQLPARVELELEKQIADLLTAHTARAALRNGFAVVAPDWDAAANICNKLAPEHLELIAEAPELVSDKLQHYGALFIGSRSAEVLGDYGAGPNHVLPTGGTARYTGGLSVFHFLRIRTWMKIGGGTKAAALIDDATALAQLEGLTAHARAAAARRRRKNKTR